MKVKRNYNFRENLFSIKSKLHGFVLLTVFVAALGTASIGFISSVHQINTYYKRYAYSNAVNFASGLDADYLSRLRAEVESEEFQQLRARAEAEGNEELIKKRLTEKSLWEQYDKTQRSIDNYLGNMSDIRYLYIMAPGESGQEDMYLIDSTEEPIYETGYWEEREKELVGLNTEELKKPTISNGNWGWLCSAYSPIYDSDGKCICIVGCDFSMEQVITERWIFAAYLVGGALLFTVIVQLIAMMFIDKTVIKPLDAITKEMTKFRPAKHLSYDQAGVINLPITHNDEISAIYFGIRTMQINIMDRLNDLFVLQEDKLRAELAIRKKEKRIDQLNEENNRDSLTGVGSKSAYAKKVDEVNDALSKGTAEFAIVMVDMNNLKQVNDEHGHKAGDQYISGCCRMVCDAFKHSPVFRIGGDEFIVVVQGSDYESRHEIFEKLKKNFEDSYAQEDKEPWLRYSASLGISENRSGDTTFDLVFRRADKAMYEEKKKFKQAHGSYR